VQQTENTTYDNAYSTHNTVIQSIYTTSATQIIYYFFIASGQLPAGSHVCAALFYPGINHTTSDDQYSVQVTDICGVVSSLSGNFP
jgi:hypothetical protein